MDLPVFSDYQAIGRNEVLVRSKLLSVESVDRDGTDANVLIAASAAGDDECTAQLADVASGIYLDSSRGAKLDKYVFDKYTLIRKKASPALGTVDFSTVIAAPSAFQIPVGTRLSTATGTLYETIAATIYPALSTGPIVVQVRSVNSGSSQQAQIGTITNIVSAIAGSPSDLAVNNSLATAGADDVEQDPSLRDRARRFWLDARRGVLQAIEDAAEAYPGVRRAAALEVIDVLGRPAHAVQLVIADAFTDALVQQDANPPAYQAQSNALAAAVFQGLADTRAAGNYVQVMVAALVLQPITLRLRFRAGANVDLTALIARATIVATVNSLRPGATMKIDDLLAALRTVPGLDYTGDEIASPVGDVVPRSLQVIRTSLRMTVAQALQTDDPTAVLVSTSLPDGLVQT